jgi:hypothetical protein
MSRLWEGAWRSPVEREAPQAAMRIATPSSHAGRVMTRKYVCRTGSPEAMA